ncbi:hypothetical protein [Erwinia sp. S59]|uniref:hypothetical protein n=1 Tax=Erwinia sp. S59 TaxID=2769340 RepID=UPI00190A1F3C|nr:hypothetical protein [Erwinia sp. S59]MBK0092805.1 hypothetical protein [Erwinia sp. S59]
MTKASKPLPRIEVFVTVVADRHGAYRIDEGIKDAATYFLDSANYTNEPFTEQTFPGVPHTMLVRNSQSLPGACKAIHTSFGVYPEFAIPGQELFEYIFCIAADAFSAKDLAHNVKIASDHAQVIYDRQIKTLNI